MVQALVQRVWYKIGSTYLAAGTGLRRAGEGIRTPDVQLGKLAFYH